MAGWYGKTGDWAMVSAPIDGGGNTIGYVILSAAPEDLNLKDLSFDNKEFTTKEEATLMDATGNSGAMHLKVNAGTKLIVLGEMKEFGLVYVEIPSAFEGKSVRGFIPLDALEM